MSRSPHAVPGTNGGFRRPRHHLLRKPVRLIALAIGAAWLPLTFGASASASDAADAGYGQARATSSVVGQVPGYSPDVANEEGYWYSRYSMMT
ncbi:MAG: hypothetical protein KGK09_04305 [Burkholderiales bacterium]|nr:hypothetical protein [Burkholderiales bacterium]